MPTILTWILTTRATGLVSECCLHNSLLLPVHSAFLAADNISGFWLQLSDAKYRRRWGTSDAAQVSLHQSTRSLRFERIHILVPACTRERDSHFYACAHILCVHVASLTNGFTTQQQGGGKASIPFSGPEQAAIWSVQVQGSLQAFLGDNKFSECVRKQQEIRQCRHTGEAVQQVSTSPSLISFFFFFFLMLFDFWYLSILTWFW